MSTDKIKGIGNDIIDVPRVRQSIGRHGQHFLDRLFTRREQDYCFKFQDPVPHFAGRFSAKEAIAKAFGTGFGAEVRWHDIEVLNNDRGQPVVFLSEALQKLFGSPRIMVSISHTAEYATAMAVWF